MRDLKARLDDARDRARAALTVGVRSGALWELRSTGFVAHAPEHALAVVEGESAVWYQGKRGFLPPVAVVLRRPAIANEPAASGPPS